MSRKNKNESNNSNVPLPGMEETVSKTPRIASIGRAVLRANEKRSHRNIFSPRIIVDDPDASAAWADIGYGKMVESKLVGQRKPDTRPVDSRFTDVGSDLRPVLEPFDATTDSVEARSVPKDISEGQQAARDVAQKIREQNIRNNMPEAIAGFIIAAGRNHGK